METRFPPPSVSTTNAVSNVEDAQSKATRATVTAFYEAFAKKDGVAMAGLYATPKDPSEHVFHDDVFHGLTAKQAGDMWRMLSGSKDLQVRFEVKEVHGNHATVEWIANYKFPPTGNPVENHVTARIDVDSSGKIVKHTDSFDLPTWLSQAFAMPSLATADPSPHFPAHLKDIEAGLLSLGVTAAARFGLWNFERKDTENASHFDRSPPTTGGNASSTRTAPPTTLASLGNPLEAQIARSKE